MCSRTCFLDFFDRRLSSCQQRKLFGAQAKSCFCMVFFPNKWAAIIEEEFRYTDKMFNGFFVGKIIDSAIIGVICFAGTTLMGFESAAFYQCSDRCDEYHTVFSDLLSVRFHVPLLLFLDNPWQALYFRYLYCDPSAGGRKYHWTEDP